VPIDDRVMQVSYYSNYFMLLLVYGQFNLFLSIAFLLYNLMIFEIQKRLLTYNFHGGFVSSSSLYF